MDYTENLPFVTTVKEDCSNADVGFILDMSNTISRRTFHREIKLIQGLVRAFDVKLGGSRAGLVTFSDNAATNIDFDHHPTVHAFNRAVRRISQSGTYVD